MPLGRGGNPAFNLALGPLGKYLMVMRQRTGGAGANRQDLGIHSMVHPDSGNILVIRCQSASAPATVERVPTRQFNWTEEALDGGKPGVFETWSQRRLQVRGQ